MDHAPLEGVLQAQRRLPDVIAGVGDRQPAPLFQNLGQAGSLHILHDQQQQALCLLGVVGGDDVGVRQLRRRLDFAVEAVERLGAVEQPLVDDLDGHRAFHEAVLGPVDHAHAAVAQLLVQLISGQDRHRRDCAGDCRDCRRGRFAAQLSLEKAQRPDCFSLLPQTGETLQISFQGGRLSDGLADAASAVFLP